jgi:hypothetical protein
MTEVERIYSVMLGMNNAETRGWIWFKRRTYRRFIFDMAEHLGLAISASEYGLVSIIVAEFAKIRAGEVKPKEDEPTFECVGCGGLTEAEGLRWKKLEDGEALTVSIDHSAKPAMLNWLTDEIIMDKWFKPWADRNPVVKFKLIKRGKGDCHIKWDAIDGPNGTLKYVWQPANDATYMEQGGDLSGDMVCDNSETRWPEALVHEAGKHEVGHVLGIGHLNSTRDVMYASARGQEKPLSTNDKREEDERYPFTVAA